MVLFYPFIFALFQILPYFCNVYFVVLAHLTIFT